MSDNRQSRQPSRLRRSESFLGVHFDFHANDDCKEIGKNTTEEMIQRMLDRIRPDYVQCDCKGHRGLSSYPTKAGYPAPGIVRDAMRVWRDVTARNGVSLYMHYSGVLDREAIMRHPDWARVDGTGEPDSDGAASTFGPYVDELLIPQLKELIDEYGVDGVWVDGECWGTHQDYSAQAIEAYRKQIAVENGNEAGETEVEIPRKPEDPGFYEFSQFCREQFRRYLRQYVDELHKHCPEFEVASNWAFSSFMPEPVTADVDFISGDYTLQNSVNNARFEGRCMARQGKPWDLMAWSFSMYFGPVPGEYKEHVMNTKTVVQMQQEAAIVLSLGGGFQVYFPQKRDGSLREWQTELMGCVAEFCRARQKFCHRAVPVPQIGLLYSTEAFYRQNTRLFGPWDGNTVAIQGVLQGLLDSQNAVEVLMEHQLTGRMKEYPLIIIPEWPYLEPSFRDELLTYVKDGGNLLVIGPEAAAMFKDELGVEFAESDDAGSGTGSGTGSDVGIWISHNGWLGGLQTHYTNASISDKSGRVAVFGLMYRNNDFKDTVGASDLSGDTASSGVAASVAKCGKGRIAGVYFNYGERYVKGATATARDFLNALVRELFPEPMVEVKGSHYVDVSVSETGGKLAVNLVNTAGPHADKTRYVFDEVPPVGPLDVMIRVKQMPAAVTLEPDGINLPFTFEKDCSNCDCDCDSDDEAGWVIKLAVPKLEIHGIIIVES